MRIVFEDSFEQDTVGNNPTKWDVSGEGTFRKVQVSDVRAYEGMKSLQLLSKHSQHNYGFAYLHHAVDYRSINLEFYLWPEHQEEAHRSYCGWTFKGGGYCGFGVDGSDYISVYCDPAYPDEEDRIDYKTSPEVEVWHLLKAKWKPDENCFWTGLYDLEGKKIEDFSRKFDGVPGRINKLRIKFGTWGSSDWDMHYYYDWIQVKKKVETGRGYPGWHETKTTYHEFCDEPDRISYSRKQDTERYAYIGKDKVDIEAYSIGGRRAVISGSFWTKPERERLYWTDCLHSNTRGLLHLPDGEELHDCKIIEFSGSYRSRKRNWFDYRMTVEEVR